MGDPGSCCVGIGAEDNADAVDEDFLVPATVHDAAGLYRVCRLLHRARRRPTLGPRRPRPAQHAGAAYFRRPTPSSSRTEHGVTGYTSPSDTIVFDDSLFDLATLGA